MTLNIKSNKWLKCLRSDHWNQRYTLCIMGLIGCTCISANNTIFYHAFEYITFLHSAKGSEFTWTSLEQSLVKASYFIGFLASSIPGSVLTDYMGGKTVFGIGCTCSGLGAILTPSVTKYVGLGGIVVIRTVIGGAEAITICGGLNLLSKWLPSKERGLLIGVFLTAPQLGLAVGYISSGYMLAKLSWFFCFHIWGGICVVFGVFFFFLCYSEPRLHPFISRHELQFLNENIPNVPEDKISFVLRRSIKSVRVWCAIVSTFGFYWCFYSIVMDLPRYMHLILHFTVAEAGAMISVPFTLMYAVSLSSCYMADFLMKKKILRRWGMRKLCAFISSVLPAFIIVGAYYSGSKKRALTVCLFGLSLVFMSFYYCGLQINTLKLSPRNLNLFFAVINSFGGMAAFLAPIVHGFITSKNEESDWYIVGWISFAFLISGIVLHLFCVSEERRWWDTRVSVDDFDDRNNVRIRLGDFETRKREGARQKVDEEEKSKQRRKGDSGEDANGGTTIKGILRTEAEESETREQSGTDAVSSKSSEEEDERTKMKGILKKEAEESKTKEQMGKDPVSSNSSEEEDERTKMKGILKKEAEESKTKEQMGKDPVSSNSSEKEDEQTKMKGILKKEAEESKTKEQMGKDPVSSKSSEEEDERTKMKGILKKEAEESKTKEQLGTDAVSSKFSDDDGERTKVKGILKKEVEETKPKEQTGKDAVSLKFSEDDGERTNIKGILKSEAEESKTKEGFGSEVSAKGNGEDDERTNIKGILKKEQKEDSEDDKHVTIVEPVDKDEDEERRKNQNDVER